LCGLGDILTLEKLAATEAEGLWKVDKQPSTCVIQHAMVT